MKVELLRSEGAFLSLYVQTESGDTFASDDGTTVTFDYVQVSLAPYLDQWLPGWRGRQMRIAVGLVPGQGKALADGTNTSGPHAYGCVYYTKSSDTISVFSFVDLPEATETNVKATMILIRGAESGTLNTARAHGLLVNVYRRNSGSAGYPNVSALATASAATVNVA